jgi:hypothetical protein
MSHAAAEQTSAVSIESVDFFAYQLSKLANCHLHAL